MNIRFSRILVTGGAGFIGSHIVDGLASEHAEVGVVDKLSARAWSGTESTANVKVHTGDITDPGFLRGVVGDYDAIIHEAALIGRGRSVDPFEIYNSNVAGTVNLLKAASDSDVKCFVYASSAAVYGEKEKLPAREHDPPNPQSHYAFSKLEGERYCKFFGEAYGLRTICLRYFNVYGARQKHGEYGGVISTFVRSLANGDAPVIFGDGNQTRDFVHVRDVVEANLLALGSNTSPGEIFNISTGKPTSINELVEMLCKLSGKTEIKPLHVPVRVDDIRHSYGDFSKAREILSYEPRFSLKDGLGELMVAGGLPEPVVAHTPSA